MRIQKIILLAPVIYLFIHCAASEQIQKATLPEKSIVSFGTKNQPVKTELRTTPSSEKKKSEFKFVQDKNITVLKSPQAYQALDLVYKHAKVGVFTPFKGKLWMYLSESSDFFFHGWYFYDYQENEIYKASNEFSDEFDRNLISKLDPFFNKRHYIAFKEDANYTRVSLYLFKELVHSWLTEEFEANITHGMELEHEEVGKIMRCVGIDPFTREIWFGKEDGLVKYNMQTDIWSRPYFERKGAVFPADFKLKQIRPGKRNVWFFGLDGNVMIYDKQRDIWDAIKEITDNYLVFLAFSDNYVWFYSDNGIWKYNPESTAWEEFEFTNYLYNKTIKHVTRQGNGFWIDSLEDLSYYNADANVWEIHRKSDFTVINIEGKKYLPTTVQDMTISGGHLWILTENGILVYNTRKGNWFIFDRLLINEYLNLDVGFFTSIYVDNVFIWIGSDNSLFRIKKETFSY